MGLMVVEPTPFTSSRLERLRANIMATLDAHGIKCGIEQDGHLLVLSVDEPVDAMYALEHVFGIRSVCIADVAENGLNPLVDAILRVGKDTMHRDERFHVEVLGSTKGLVARDVEFAATAALLSELSSLGVKPSSKYYDRLIRVYISDENAYVCRLCREGAGGLPVGSNGHVLCSVYDCISAVAAYALAEHGFYPSIVVVYKDDEMLRRVAKRIGVIAGMLPKKSIELRYTYYTPRSDYGSSGEHDHHHYYNITLVASLLLDRLTRVLDTGSIIALPLSSSLHSMDFINSVRGRMNSKDVILPLMFSSDLLHRSSIFGVECLNEVQAISRYNESGVVYDEHVDEYVEECMSNMHTLEVVMNPNIVHDIIDGIRKGKGKDE